MIIHIQYHIRMKRHEITRTTLSITRRDNFRWNPQQIDLQIISSVEWASTEYVTDIYCGTTCCDGEISIWIVWRFSRGNLRRSQQFRWKQEEKKTSNKRVFMHCFKFSISITTLNQQTFVVQFSFNAIFKFCADFFAVLCKMRATTTKLLQTKFHKNYKHTIWQMSKSNSNRQLFRLKIIVFGCSFHKCEKTIGFPNPKCVYFFLLLFLIDELDLLSDCSFGSSLLQLHLDAGRVYRTDSHTLLSSGLVLPND